MVLPAVFAQVAPQQKPDPNAKVSSPTGKPDAAVQPPTAAGWGTQTFDVKYVDPELLRDMFSDRSFVMEANRDLKCLTARGSPAFLKEVEDAVKRFDVAPPLPQNIQITVYLLTVAAQAPTGVALPPELAAIGKELAANKGPVLRLADSQMMRLRVGQSAEASGQPGAPEAAALSRVKLQSASVTAGPKGDLISLNGLRVWLTLPATPGAAQAPAKTDADVVADVDVKPKEAILVAKTGLDKPQVVVVLATVVN